MDAAQPIGGPRGLLRHLVETDGTDVLSGKNLPERTIPNSRIIYPNKLIQELITAGKSKEALSHSLDNFKALSAQYGDNHQHTLNSLANLLEISVLAKDRSLVTQPYIEQLKACAFNPNLSLGHFRMRVVSRLCEFSAHFGAKSQELRDIASEALECMQRIYPFADVDEQSKAYSARASLVSAAHIAHWTAHEENPDFRGLDYMASCAYERLAIFGQCRSDFYMGLYELRRGKLESAVERFDRIASESTGAGMELACASLEASIRTLLERRNWNDAQLRVDELSKILGQPETLGNFTRVRERLKVYRDTLARR